MRPVIVWAALVLPWAPALFAAAQPSLKGEVKLDGSSTVYLISEAVAVEFKKVHPGVAVSVGISGTGGGFKKFAAGETDINDASRAITDQERQACRRAGFDVLELQVAWDGLVVALHPDNTWAKRLTVEQLRRIWHPDLAARTWRDVDPSWPAQEIRLYGPGPSSGTFDYFTEAVNGKEKLSRKDYEASEDDQVLVKGVSANRHALGYFGLAYFEQNRDRLAAAAVMNPQTGEYVLPDRASVLDRRYRPLARPLYLYVRTDALRRPEVREFVRFYQRRSDDVVPAAGYVAQRILDRARQQLKLEDALRALDAPPPRSP